MPRPPAESKLFLVRLPNILAFQPRPFDPETFEEEDAADADETGSKTRAENVIRWRESQETGSKQSNARMVTWSDGSMTLHVGSEVLMAQHVGIPEGSTHLYTRHKGSHLECHGVLKQKMTLAPASRQSKTHQALTHKIAREHTKGKKMQLIATTEDPEAMQRGRERDYEDKKRLMARQATHRARADEYAESGQLTADFLDAADDEDLEGNLGAIRAQFKNRKRGGPSGAGRRSSGGGSSSRKAPRRPGGGRRRNSDGEDDDDDDDDDDDEDEEEDEGDPAEMDGFIVGDDDEEEAESSEEERPSKKRGKKKKAHLADGDEDDDEDDDDY